MTRLASRDTVRVERVEVEPTVDQREFPVGAWVSIYARQGVFKVHAYAKDGSLLLYGGTWGRATAHLGYRNAYPSSLRLAVAPIREDDE